MSNASETPDPADNPYRLTDDDLQNRKAQYAPDMLAGQTVLISGGGSGIGRATAWLAGRVGAKVIVAGRTAAKLAAVSESMQAAGLDCQHLEVNIRDRASVDAMFEQLGADGLCPDLLINSAGGQFPQAAIDYSTGGWNAVIDTNLNGTFHMMQAAARFWRDQQAPGSIVNLVTVSRGLHGVAHSNAARAAVITFSECVSVEWAPLNIRVNCVAPGTVQTEGWLVYPEEARQTYPTTNPMQRVGDPWEIAHACLYMGGPAGSYVTGETLNIDGAGRHWGEIWTTGQPEYFDISNK